MGKTYNRKDRLYTQAKDQGFRSRAAYKLVELDKKYKLLSPGLKVLDLGAWPGGWLQVCSKAIGPKGMVIGVDLEQIEAFTEQNIKVMAGDVSSESVITQALEIAHAQFDLLLSDLSPKLTGIRELDQANVLRCAELAYAIAERALRLGGNFVLKAFKHQDIEAFVRRIRAMFNKLIRTELDSSRNSSNEFYLIGLGWNGGVACGSSVSKSNDK